MSILVTGGAGYIGSHTCVVLLEAGLDVVVVDNLVNSHPEALSRVEEMTGRSLTFHEVDLRDGPALDAVFRQHDVDAVIHFAALKAVGESVAQPLRYYRNNVVGTLTLLETMVRHDIYDFVFSSSATVYGDPERVPLDEEAPLSATNPYGWTKLMMEQIMRDAARADARWKVILLRYFNPVGAHPSGRIGEDPSGIPNNLMPFIAQVAVGRREKLRVFGDDYDTPDGTGVRDYIHVMDLAEGHLAALRRLAELEEGTGAVVYNLGTGRGYSVLEVRRAFEEASGRPIPYEIVERRPGDVPTLYADPALAEKELGWKATRSLEQMCADVWRWQSANPHGYGNE